MADPNTPKENFTDDLKLGQLSKDSVEFKRLHEYVRESLRLAAAGNKDYEALLKNDETRRVVESFIDYYAGIGVRYLPEGTSDARHSPELADKHLKERDALKNSIDGFVENYLESVHASKTKLEESIQKMGTGGIVVTERMIAGKETIDQLILDTEKIRKRQRFIVDFKNQLILLLADEKQVGTAMTATKEFKLKLTTEKLADDRLQTLLDSIDLIFTQNKAQNKIAQADIDLVFKALDAFGELPPEKRNNQRVLRLLIDNKPERNPNALAGDQISFSDALYDIDQKLVQEQEQRKRLLFQSFPERARFLHHLGGSNTLGLMEASRRADGKMDFETMSVMLQTMLKKETDDRFSATTLASNADFKKFDDAKVQDLARKYTLTEDGVRELAEGILRNGKNIVITEDAYRLRAGNDYYSCVSALFGKEVFEDARANAKQVSQDDIDFYLKEYHPNLTIPDDVAFDLISAWNPESLKNYLEEPVLGYKNPSGISLPESYARASLPAAFVTFLSNNKLQTPVSTIYGISLMHAFPQDGNVTPAFAQELSEILIDKEGYLDKKEFESVFQLLFNVPDVTSILKNTEIFSEVNSKYKLVDAAKFNDVLEKDGGTSRQIGPIVLGHLKEVHTSGLDKKGVLKSVKMNTGALWRTAKFGGGLWVDYIKNLDGLVRDTKGIDTALEKSFLRTDGLEEARKEFAAIQSQLAKSEDDSRKTNELLFAQEEERILAEEIGSGLLRVPDRGKNAKAGIMLLEHMSRIHARLEKAGIQSQTDPDIRLTAYFLAREKSIEEAENYLRDPKTYNLDDDAGKRVQEQINQAKLIQVAEEKDVLLPLKYELNVGVVPQASLILYGRSLLEGDSHYQKWLTHPAQARGALDAILFLVDPKQMDGKKPLIEAFCTGVTQTIQTESGPRTLTQADAIRYVEMIQKNLSFQSSDLDRSAQLLENKDRQTDPLEILRKGAGSIGKLLRSKNWTEWGVGVAILAAIGYVLKEQWKKDGWGKSLMLGLPLLYGADVVIKDLAGKGALERLGLTWMSEKDRNAAVEIFLREQSRHQEYADVNSEAGFEAIKAMQDVPVAELLTWKAHVDNQAGKKNYATHAPRGVKNSASGVAKAMGTLNKTKDTEEQGCQFIHKVLDSFCADIARRHPQSQSAASGVEIIKRKYVTFEEPYMKAFEAELKTKPPFTMLQVLIFERPTPAMQQEIFQNDTLVEWALHLAGIGVEEAKAKIRAGMSFAQILYEDWKRKGLEYASQGKDVALDTADKFWKWARLSGTKLYDELKEDSDATMNLVLGTLSAAGVVAVDKGEGVLEWTYDVTKQGANLTIGAAKETYRFLHRHQVLGNAMEFFEEGMKTFFGTTIAELLILEENIETDEEHVAKLAERSRFTEALERQLGTVVRMPNQFEKEYLASWIQEAYREVFSADIGNMNAFDNVDPYKKMAVYELVKRRIYSQILAHRIKKIASLPQGKKLDLPLDVTLTKSLNISDPMVKAIEKTYGYNTLASIGNENTLAGMLQNKAQNQAPGAARLGLEFLRGSVAWMTRDKATEYRIFQLQEYLHPYLKQAEKHFAKDPDGLRLYRSYLETIVTNATIDLSLGALEIERERGVDSGTLPTNMPLTLMISQAQGYLNYLRAARSSSADLIRMDGIPLGAFAIEAGVPPELAQITQNELNMRRIQSVDPSEVVDVPQPKTDDSAPETAPELTEEEKKTLSDLPLSSVENVQTLLAAIPRADDATENAFRNRFDIAANSIGNINNKTERQRGLLILQGATEAGAQKARKALLPYYNKTNSLAEVISERDGAKNIPERARLQEFLDACVVLLLESLIKEIEPVPREKVGTHGKKSEWERELLSLYKATSQPPNNTSDLVSFLLEYVAFQGQWSSKDKDGKKYFEKYSNYLMKNTKLPPPPEDYYFYEGGQYPAAKRRTARDSGANNIPIANTLIAKRKRELALP